MLLRGPTFSKYSSGAEKLLPQDFVSEGLQHGEVSEDMRDEWDGIMRARLANASKSHMNELGCGMWRDCSRFDPEARSNGTLDTALRCSTTTPNPANTIRSE
ncbi:hypothetical protein ACEPAI_8881 [Sanghuangporus weigelae]